MKIDFNSLTPVYIQLINVLEEDIINDVYKENEKFISTTNISKLYNVNPSTSKKSISIMTERNLLYKKPGIGMFISENAKDIILEERIRIFKDKKIKVLIEESKLLSINLENLIVIIKEKYND